jgi:uncharacterized protein HemX
MSSWVQVLIAIVGAGGPVTVLIGLLSKTNTTQHLRALDAQERTLLEVQQARKDLRQVEHRLSDDIHRVENRLDRHIDHHIDRSVA